MSSYLAISTSSAPAAWLRFGPQIPDATWRQICAAAPRTKSPLDFAPLLGAERRVDGGDAAEVIADAARELAVGAWSASFPKSPWNMFGDLGPRELGRHLSAEEAKVAGCTWSRLAATLSTSVPCPIHGAHATRAAPSWWVHGPDCLQGVTTAAELSALAELLRGGPLLRVLPTLGAELQLDAYARDAVALAGFIASLPPEVILIAHACS